MSLKQINFENGIIVGILLVILFYLFVLDERLEELEILLNQATFKSEYQK